MTFGHHFGEVGLVAAVPVQHRRAGVQDQRRGQQTAQRAAHDVAADGGRPSHGPGAHGGGGPAQHLRHPVVHLVQQDRGAECLALYQGGLRQLAQRHGLLGKAVPLPEGPDEGGAADGHGAFGQIPLCFGQGGGHAQQHDGRPAFLNRGGERRSSRDTGRALHCRHGAGGAYRAHGFEVCARCAGPLPSAGCVPHG